MLNLARFSSILAFFFFLHLTTLSAQADQIINIPDPNLAAGIRYWLQLPGDQPITDEAMLNLTELVLAGRDDIYSLDGLQYATNLTSLWMGDYHRLQDLSPIAGLQHLTSLHIVDCGTTDISVIDTLPMVQDLDFSEDGIECLPSFANNIGQLSLAHNQITDISPLTVLTKLGMLDLSDNPLSQKAYDVDIPLIQANNSPLMLLYYDAAPEPKTVVLFPMVLLFILFERRAFCKNFMKGLS